MIEKGILRLLKELLEIVTKSQAARPLHASYLVEMYKYYKQKDTSYVEK